MQIVSEKLSDQKYLSLFMALWSCHPRPSRVGVVRAVSRQVPSAVMTEHRLTLSGCHRKKEDLMNKKIKTEMESRLHSVEGSLMPTILNLPTAAVMTFRAHAALPQPSLSERNAT